MNARTKKVLRIAAIPFSLALIGGYLAVRASGGLAFGTKAEPVAGPASEAAATAAEPDPMMFSGSKSGAIFTPAPAKLEPKEMFVGSKSGPIAHPEDFKPTILPADAFKLPPAKPNAQNKPPAKPADQSAKPQPK